MEGSSRRRTPVAEYERSINQNGVKTTRTSRGAKFFGHIKLTSSPDSPRKASQLDSSVEKYFLYTRNSVCCVRNKQTLRKVAYRNTKFGNYRITEIWKYSSILVAHRVYCCILRYVVSSCSPLLSLYPPMKIFVCVFSYSLLVCSCVQENKAVLYT